MAVNKEQMAELTKKFEEAGHIQSGEQQQQTAEQQNTDGLSEEERAAAQNTQNTQNPASDGDKEVELQLTDQEASDLERIQKALDANEEMSDEDQTLLEALQAKLPAENTDGDGSPETYSVSDFAAAVGWEAKDVYDGIMVPLDDGQEPLSLGQLKNSHQNLIREHNALKEQHTQLEQQAAGGGVQPGAMSQEMIQAYGHLASLDRMEEQTDWKDLERRDPGQAALRRQKFAEARQEVGDYMQELQGKQREAMQAARQQATTKMVELIPSWSDQTAKSADFATIKARMAEVGFSEQEANSIMDPRTMVLLKELIDLRAQVAQAQGAVKRVRVAPKVLRNAQGRFSSPNPQNIANDAVAKAKSTGKRDDQVRAVAALLQTRNSPNTPVR